MRINLKVAFKDKDKAKSLGARWDYERRTWFICNMEDLTPFMRWIPKSPAPAHTESAKQSPTPAHSSCKAGTSRVNERFWARTGPKVFVPLCHCDALPWDDCEHTDRAAELAMRDMLSA